MPVTYSINTGDGVLTPRVRLAVTLPDTGGTIKIAGEVQAPGEAVVKVPYQSVPTPADPVAGTLWWSLQVDYQTGVAQVITSTVSDPVVREKGPKPLLHLLSSLQPAAFNVPPGSGRLNTRTGDQSVSLVVMKSTMSVRSAGGGLLLLLELLPQTGLPVVQAGPVVIPNY